MHFCSGVMGTLRNFLAFSLLTREMYEGTKTSLPTHQPDHTMLVVGVKTTLVLALGVTPLPWIFFCPPELSFEQLLCRLGGVRSRRLALWLGKAQLWRWRLFLFEFWCIHVCLR